MIRISGKFFSGGRSDSESAILECDQQVAKLVLGESSVSHQLDTLVISDRLAGLMRTIQFSDGGIFSTPDNDSVDTWLAANDQLPGFSIVSFFESSWRWSLLALAAVPFVLFLMFTIGMPVIAKPVAHMVPDSVKESLDEEFVELLDREVMEMSELTLDHQNEIQALFKQLYWAHESELFLRKGGAMGANALALPGGTVVITDELISMVEHDGELVAVLAHEVGHVYYNHSMRIFVQSAGVSLVMGWLLGDLSVVTDFVLVGAPVLLQQLSYSRKLETEADTFALSILNMEDYSAQCFSSLMQKLSTSHGDIENMIPDYLSSHPNMESRIEQGSDDEPCSYGMSQVDWKATPKPTKSE